MGRPNCLAHEWCLIDIADLGYWIWDKPVLPQSCLLGVGGPSSAGGVLASSGGGSLVSPLPVDESLNTEPLRSDQWQVPQACA